MVINQLSHQVQIPALDFKVACSIKTCHLSSHLECLNVFADKSMLMLLTLMMDLSEHIMKTMWLLCQIYVNQ